MSAPRVELLNRQLDIAMALFDHHTGDLSDEECRWEPAPGAWNVRPDAEGRWAADWAEPEPVPAPVVTIGWVTWHIGFWWTTTAGHCFGSGAPAREDIVWPGTAEGAVEWVRSLDRRWRAELAPLTDADLDSAERTATLPWGAGMTLADIAGWVTVELTKNVSEVGLLRHLYAHRAS